MKKFEIEPRVFYWQLGIVFDNGVRAPIYYRIFEIAKFWRKSWKDFQ